MNVSLKKILTKTQDLLYYYWKFSLQVLAFLKFIETA